MKIKNNLNLFINIIINLICKIQIKNKNKINNNVLLPNQQIAREVTAKFASKNNKYLIYSIIIRTSQIINQTHN